jgi:stearoyl-CoA desaturase (delta-9 desaturase)
MKIYSAIGYSLIALHVAAAEVAAPAAWQPLKGAAAGLAYLMFTWLISGLYVAHMLHMGLAHRALEFRSWFLKTVTLVSCVAGIYVDPKAWVDRHRHHHAFSDRPGDPTKQPGDGFWKTLWLCFVPYACRSDMAPDPVFRTRVFRLVCHPWFGPLAHAASFLLLWALVGDALFALVMWLGARFLGLWVNMLQNYWTHDRRWGVRRYEDEDNDAMNVTEWLPVTATFSACMQNNHHKHARFARMSHEDGQYDFGWTSVQWMEAAGLVRVLPEGRQVPEGVDLAAARA